MAVSELDYRADRLTALHQVKAFINPFQRQLVGDQVIDIELAFHVPVDNLRHVGATTRTAECRALPDPAGNQLEWPGADFLTGCRHADDDRLAPALVTTFQRLAHGGGIANALEAVIGAAIGEANNRIDHIADVLGVNKMGHTELARHGFACRIEINPDDLVGTDHTGCLNHVQADPAQTEHTTLAPASTLAVNS